MAFSNSVTAVTGRQVGTYPEGSPVQSFTLSNDMLQLEILSYGARITSLTAPDRESVPADVVLGYADWQAYLTDDKFLGCTAGRFANRIKGGRFSLDGETYRLSVNNGPNTLHGGAGGFFRRNWEARVVDDGVSLSLVSEEGDQGFPGTLRATVTYRLQGDTVRIDYRATTDRPTVVNLTNHAYFNLAGEGSPSILDHELTLEADGFVPTDATGIPLGFLAPVKDTPFDFTAPRRVGERIEAEDEQLRAGSGYDHTFVLRGQEGVLRRAATVTHAGSGRRLEIATTEPGVQFYSGNYLSGSGGGRSGRPYERRSALCLETQHFPDSPNQTDFPTTTLRPGALFESTTTLRLMAV